MNKFKQVTLLAIIVLMQAAAGLFAQSGKEGSRDSGGDILKQLLLKKFDVNGDGDLAPFEKVEAVEFLKGVDVNEDGQMSSVEQGQAIKLLRAMKAPSERRATDKMTLENRNRSKRSADWGEFIKKLPHGAGPRIFTSTRPPGSPGFNVNGEKMVGVKLVKVRDIPLPLSNKQLAEKRAELKSEQELEAKRLGRKVFPVPSKKAIEKLKEKKSFYQDTVILAKDGRHTVLPIGAVLHLPASLKGLIVAEPTGKWLLWPDFQKKHARLFALREVSWDIAMGHDLISDKEKKRFEIGKKIVVAVYKNNPVGVMPPSLENEKTVGGAVVSDIRNKNNKK